MKYGRKLMLLSASLLVLHLVSGCESLRQELGWEDRTLPDGDIVNFQNRHAPPLNPTPGSTRGIMHIPSENSQQGGQATPAAGDTTSPTSMAVPVVPVTTVAMDSVPASNSGSYPSLTSVPQTPTVPSKGTIQSSFSSMQAQQQASESARSKLMNDANATVMTSPQTGQLVSNPADAMPAGAPALQPPTSSVPAAAASAGAPQQGSTAVASNTGSDSGFNSWLHGLKNMFSKKQPTATADASAMKTPVENPPLNPNAYSPAAPAEAAASIPPAPPAMAASAPTTIPAPEPYSLASQNTAPVLHDPTAKSAFASTAPAPTATSLAPIPPLESSSAAQQLPPDVSSNALPDISQLTRQDNQPVTLVQPSGTPLGDNYIDTSRYPQND